MVTSLKHGAESDPQQQQQQQQRITSLVCGHVLLTRWQQYTTSLTNTESLVVGFFSGEVLHDGYMRWSFGYFPPGCCWASPMMLCCTPLQRRCRWCLDLLRLNFSTFNICPVLKISLPDPASLWTPVIYNRFYGEATLKALDKKGSAAGVIWVMFLGCEWRRRPAAPTPTAAPPPRKANKQRQRRRSESRQSRLEFKVLQHPLVSRSKRWGKKNTFFFRW